MAFFTDQRVNAMTQESLLPTVFDQSIAATALSLRIIANGKTWKGRQMVVPVKLTNSSQATSFAGLDTFTAAELATKNRMAFDLRAIRQPVAISGLEMIANDYPETQVIDMVTEALEETQIELADYMAGIFYGFGTGNSSKDLLGIGVVADDGTNVSTVGGLSRTTYTVLKGTYTSSSGTLGLDKMATLYSNVSSAANLAVPTLAPTTKTVFDLYEQLLTPTVRETYSETGKYNLSASMDQAGGMSREGLVGRTGFTAISYRGVPLVRDEKCTSGTLFMLNENTFEWRGAKATENTGYKSVGFSSSTIANVYGEAPMKQISGFNWSTFRAPMNQFGVVADIIIAGNLVIKRPNRNGQLNSITGV